MPLGCVLRPGEADDAWDDQVDPFARAVTAWTGNRCAVVEYTTGELAALMDRGRRPARAPTLGRLLKLKNKSQYQTVDGARSDAIKAVEWAATLVDGATGIVPK